MSRIKRSFVVEYPYDENGFINFGDSTIIHKDKLIEAILNSKYEVVIEESEKPPEFPKSLRVIILREKE